MINSELEKVTDFIQEHLKYKDRELIKTYVQQHNQCGTIDYAIDEHGNIIGLCRWNMSDDGTVGKILDLAIREDWRKRGLGRDFVLRAINKFPKATHLEFQRGVRGDERTRKLPISRILESTVF